jgi:WD40 repeat protein
VRTFVAHTAQITGLAFSADGRSLATGGEDGTVGVWEAASGTLRRQFAGHLGPVTAIAFSPDGALLVSGARTVDSTLLVWDVTGRLREERRKPPGPLPGR